MKIRVLLLPFLTHFIIRREKLVCQAESEQDLQSWLARLTKRRRSQTDSAIATASSTAASTTTTLDRTHTPSTLGDDEKLKHSPTIVSYHSSATLHGLTLANTMSLSAVMVYEITTASHVSIGKLPKYFWGIPWPLSGSMLLSSAKPLAAREDITSWPLYDDTTLAVDLPGYPAPLLVENKTLRHLFVGVSPSEIVMDGRYSYGMHFALTYSSPSPCSVPLYLATQGGR